MIRELLLLLLLSKLWLRLVPNPSSTSFSESPLRYKSPTTPTAALAEEQEAESIPAPDKRLRLGELGQEEEVFDILRAEFERAENKDFFD